jgi:hypothetical protein
MLKALKRSLFCTKLVSGPSNPSIPQAAKAVAVVPGATERGVPQGLHSLTLEGAH